LLSFASDEVQIDSKIDQVKVYRQKAQLVRKASAQVKAGDNILILSGLSQHIIPNSITVKGKGDGVIQSVKHRVTYLNRTPKTPRMIMLEDSLNFLQEDLNAIKDEKFVFEQEQKLILANNKIGGTEKGLTAAELQEVSNLYRNRLKEIRDKLRELKRQEVKLGVRTSAYQQEQREIMSLRNQPTQEVVVAFRAKSSGSVKLELIYLVNNASWSPFYDIRVENTRDPLQFFLKANVVNATGIDWKRVKLILSTASNAGNNTSPTLNPWYVDVMSVYNSLQERRNAEKGYSNRIEVTTSETFADGDMDKREEEKLQYTYEYTTTEENTLSLEFNISLRYDIPTDGKEYQVDIQLLDVDGSFQHFAVPKLDKDAFLVAYIKQDLLRGPANVYFEGTYVGETNIYDAPEDSIKISLGRDAKVLIERELVEDYSVKKVIGSSVKQMFTYKITVKNNKDDEVNLTLEDQIPVSKNKEIKVTLLDEGGAELQEENGKLTWKLRLKPGERQEIRFSFEAKYPKNLPVSGF